MMSVSLKSLDVITSKSSVVDVGGRINVTASSVLIRRTTLLCDIIQLLKSVTSSVALNSTRIHDCDVGGVGAVGITFSMCGFEGITFSMWGIVKSGLGWCRCRRIVNTSILKRNLKPIYSFKM
jgi:hypothetical protein